MLLFSGNLTRNNSKKQTLEFQQGDRESRESETTEALQGRHIFPRDVFGNGCQEAWDKLVGTA